MTNAELETLIAVRRELATAAIAAGWKIEEVEKAVRDLAPLVVGSAPTKMRESERLKSARVPFPPT